SASRRSHAVETPGIIRPLRVAEIGCAAREAIGFKRLPNGIGQVGGGFNHDIEIWWCPKDREAKTVGVDAKTGIVVQNFWRRQFPRRCWKTVKRRAPASGAGQVIDRRRGDA